MPNSVDINNMLGCGRRTNEEDEKEAASEDLHKDDREAKQRTQTMWAQTPHRGGRTKATDKDWKMQATTICHSVSFCISECEHKRHAVYNGIISIPGIEQEERETIARCTYG